MRSYRDNVLSVIGQSAARFDCGLLALYGSEAGLDSMANICEPMINLVKPKWLKMLISHNQNGAVVKLPSSKLEAHGSNTTGEESGPNLSCQQHETW